MSNFYFLYGEDSFSLKDRLNQIKDKFLVKNSELDIVNISGSELTKNNFLSDVCSMPFFCTKRLIIISNLLTGNKDSDLKKYIAEKLNKLDKSVFLIFVEEGSPDKRSALFKALNQKGRAMEFSGLAELQIKNFIRNKILKNSLKISQKEIDYLFNLMGNDLWLISNSLEKIILYIKAKNLDMIEIDDIDQMVRINNSPKIYHLTDSIAQKQSSKALECLHDLLESGSNELQILSVVVGQYRSLLMLSCLEKQRLSSSQMAGKLKLHPFVVSKNLSLLKKYRYEELVKIFSNLQKIDAKIKKGLIEPGLSLDLLVLTLCTS